MRAVTLFAVLIACLAIGAFAHESRRHVEQPQPVNAAVGSGLECTVCEFVLGQIDNYITSNSTEAEIVQVVERICNVVPKTLTQVCDAYIETYGDYVIALLVQKVSPAEVCTKLGLCKSEDVDTAVQGSLECPVCEWVMGEIEKYITSNSTEAEIAQVVSHICNIVPQSYRSICTSYLEEYAPMIIQLLVQREDPDTICKQIHLCQTASVEEPVEGSIECAICEWVMGEIEKYITSNSTEAEIIRIVDNICNIAPSSLRPLCQSFIAEYGQQVIQLLVNREPPATICTQLSLCKSVTVTMHRPMQAGGAYCGVCEFIAEKVEALVSSQATEAEIAAELEKACTKLGPIAAVCQAGVAEYLPYLIDLAIQAETPEKICQALGVCSSGVAVMPEPLVAHEDVAVVDAQPEPDNGLECALCEWVMTELENKISSNSTEQEIEAALLKVCNELPRSVASACDDLVNTYAVLIINLLVQKESPDTICEQIRLCQRTDEPVTVVAVEQDAPNSLKCVACEWVMSEVENYINSSTTEAQLTQFLENVCNIVPSALRSECDALIQQYLPVIVQLLLQKEPPSSICGQIGLCGGRQSVEAASPAPNDFKCVACQWIMSEVESYINSSTTEAEIAQFLQNVCNIVPSFIRSECQAIIQQYAPTIIQLLLQKENPDTICAQIGLCGSKVTVPVVTAPAPNDWKCVACEWVVAEAENFVQENRTEQEIFAFVEKVCDFLPSMLKSECDVIISAYGPLLVQKLIQKESPATLCTQVGVCKSQQRTEAAPAPNDWKCTACEWVMSEAENFLVENRTEQEIIAFLGSVCNWVPSAIRQECEDILDQYGPEIIQLLVNREPPATICTQIGICKSVRPVAPTPAPAAAKASAGECALCTWLITKADALLEEPITDEKVVKALETVCNVLPAGDLRITCQSLIEAVGPDVIQLIAQDADPAKICHALRAC